MIGLASQYATVYGSTKGTSTIVQQGIFICIGIVVYVVASMVDYRRFRPFGPILYGTAILLLIAVLFFGKTINSTTGWFRFGTLGFQPIELVKVFWILIAGWFLLSRGQHMDSWKTVGFFGLLLLPIVALTMAQPDLGSTLVVLAVTFGLLLVTNIRRKQVLFIIVIAVLIFVLAWTSFLKPYQKDRILVLIDPGRDPLGQGYNVSQSIIAIGSGGWLGRGLGFGPQSQLNYIPAQQTDFIFAVIAEELGFVGSFVLLSLYGVMLFRCVKIAMMSRESFGTIVSFGVMLLLFFHVLENIGMTLGLFPVAGIPLPFISYGGSSLIAFIGALGIVQNIAVNAKQSYGAHRS